MDKILQQVVFKKNRAVRKNPKASDFCPRRSDFCPKPQKSSDDLVARFKRLYQRLPAPLLS